MNRTITFLDFYKINTNHKNLLRMSSFLYTEYCGNKRQRDIHSSPSIDGVTSDVVRYKQKLLFSIQ